MKYLLKYSIFSLLVVISLSLWAANDKVDRKVLNDYQTVKKQYDDLKNEVEGKKNSLASKKKQFQSDSIGLDKMNVELQNLQNSEILLKEKETEIDTLKVQVKQLKEDMVLTAVKFLDTPYEEISINEVALNAYEKGKGSDAYTQNKPKKILLQNYKTDWHNLTTFLQKYKDTITYKTAGNAKSELMSLSLYDNYMKNGKETYLGKIISDIATSLSNANSADDDANIRNTLKECYRLLQ